MIYDIIILVLFINFIDPAPVLLQLVTKTTDTAITTKPVEDHEVTISTVLDSLALCYFFFRTLWIFLDIWAIIIEDCTVPALEEKMEMWMGRWQLWISAVSGE